MRVYINWLDSFADNEEVLGSSPSTRTTMRNDKWLRHLVYTEKLAGSSPAASTFLYSTHCYNQQIEYNI